MNWDLIIGLIIGLSGSIIALFGTIITNKQNHAHQIEINRQNHEHEIKVNNQKQELEKELEIQRIALENSFKDFETSRQFNSRETGEDVGNQKVFPYDMYLLMYMKIAEFMNRKDKEKYNELDFLLSELKTIQSTYEYYDRSE